MSYCRFAWNGSDVYVYGGSEGLVCCGCHLFPDTFFTAQTPEDMIAHLAEHKKAGHFVPTYAIDRLWQEIEGPNEPVTPEPESLTQAREQIMQAREELKHA